MNEQKLDNRIERILDQLDQFRDDTRKLKAGQGEIKTRLTQLEKKLNRLVCAAALAGSFIGALVGSLL